jgi:hypothetical protein
MPDDLQLHAPGIAKIAAQLAVLIRADADFRKLQGQNAQQAKYFDQPGVFTTIGSVAVTGVVLYSIQQAQSDNEKFYSLVLTFDATSGSGRYRIDGPAPTATIGVAIPAGGTVLTILGADNIRNFKMIAEGGQTLSFSRYVFV